MKSREFFAQQIFKDGETLGLFNISGDAGFVETVLTVVFTIGGAVATIFVIIGSVRYALSTGDPERVNSAKNTIVYALIGIIVSASAVALVTLVANVAGEAI